VKQAAAYWADERGAGGRVDAIADADFPDNLATSMTTAACV
jgi:hypothetical protein